MNAGNCGKVGGRGEDVGRKCKGSVVYVFIMNMGNLLFGLLTGKSEDDVSFCNVLFCEKEVPAYFDCAHFDVAQCRQLGLRRGRG